MPVDPARESRRRNKVTPARAEDRADTRGSSPAPSPPALQLTPLARTPGGSQFLRLVVSELRLMLRLMRYKKMRAEFGAITAALCYETMAAAAE